MACSYEPFIFGRGGRMRLEIVLLLQTGLTPKTVGRILGIPVRTVYYYKKELKLAKERLESIEKRGLIK
jgi:hypothetical protein